MQGFLREYAKSLQLDLSFQDFESEAMRITGGEGVDLIIDALGPTSFRKDYRLLRPGGRLVMYGLSEVTNESGRDIPAALKSFAKMPLATIPWWKSLALMNENKGVFGLNMLKWWEREGSLDRIARPYQVNWSPSIDGFCHFRELDRPISQWVTTSSETAAAQEGIDLDLLRLQSQYLRCHKLIDALELAA